MSERIDINEFAGGAVAEKLSVEMDKVVENIYDVNTDPKIKRKIVIEIAFTPDEERDMAAIEVKAKTTLAPEKSTKTKILIGRGEDGKVTAIEKKDQLKGQLAVEDVQPETVETDEKGLIDFRKSQKKAN